MKVDFNHIQSAHCENGVTTNLLKHVGINEITEPLAFGMGAGLFFIYIPFLKVNNGPAFSYRSMPGQIFKRTCTSLHIPVTRKKYSSPEKAMRELDKLLEKGQPVGAQVGVYYLTYFPKEYRFHFNAHNLVVFGKEGDNYLISDPVMEEATTLTSYELQRVRFAKGPLAPRGQIYYPGKDLVKPDEATIARAIKSGIKHNTKMMIRVPGSIVGVSGIKYTAKLVSKWRDKYGVKKGGQYLAQLVRMQEEIGTGGGGFRYIYAAFLQQAHGYIPNDDLLSVSEEFTKAGDLWRNAAVQSAGIYKGRITAQADFDVIRDQLFEIAEIEKGAFKRLEKIKWK
ncbi:BtrH N-terminal domain-containing protein [Owenweeksia hongkongensis]|uniref:BtrH N-terminal domain-containing protein n=1 Tax=Owenweeksia hongkongensis TaxID=253245 RepID=UPI003A90AA34